MAACARSVDDCAHPCIPPGVAAALARGGWLELPTLRNLAVCSRGTLAEGGIAERFSACSAPGGAVHAAPG